MIKTVIYRAEGVILNEELVRFKIYEKLWYYLRQDPRWKNFEDILKLREYYISRTGTSNAYQLIAGRYLSERNEQRFQQDLQLFLKKLGNFYVRPIPGMLPLNTSLNYYYKTVLIGDNGPFFEKARRKLGLNYNFNFIFTRHPAGEENSFRSLLQEILQKTRSSPEETVLCTNRMRPDIISAKQLGIRTILTRFNLTITGFMPQSNPERHYAASISKIPENAAELSAGRTVPDAVANTPLQIVSIIQGMEEGRKAVSQGQPEEPRRITLWDIAREVLNMPDFDNNPPSRSSDAPPLKSDKS